MIAGDAVVVGSADSSESSSSASSVGSADGDEVELGAADGVTSGGGAAQSAVSLSKLTASVLVAVVGDALASTLGAPAAEMSVTSSGAAAAVAAEIADCSAGPSSAGPTTTTGAPVNSAWLTATATCAGVSASRVVVQPSGIFTRAEGPSPLAAGAPLAPAPGLSSSSSPEQPAAMATTASSAVAALSRTRPGPCPKDMRRPPLPGHCVVAVPRSNSKGRQGPAQG